MHRTTTPTHRCHRASRKRLNFDTPDPQHSPFISNLAQYAEPKPRPAVSPVVSHPSELPADDGAHKRLSYDHENAPSAPPPM